MVRFTGICAWQSISYEQFRIQTEKLSPLTRLWIVRRGHFIINACSGTSSWLPNVDNDRNRS
jgi:hypothetical protein